MARKLTENGRAGRSPGCKETVNDFRHLSAATTNWTPQMRHSRPPYIRPWRRLASPARGRADLPGGFDPPVVPDPRSAAVARMVRRPAEVVRLDIVIPDLQDRGPPVRGLPVLLDVHFRALLDPHQLRPAARFSAELVHVTHGPGGSLRVEHAQRRACIHDAAGIVNDAYSSTIPRPLSVLAARHSPW